MKIKSIYFDTEELKVISSALWAYVAEIQNDINKTPPEAVSEETSLELNKAKELADELDFLITPDKSEVCILT